MQKPDNCPDIVYNMMKDCWERNPDNRPSFLDICERLLPGASSQFHANSFYLSSQGAEAVANQAAQRHAAEEADISTPLTNNGGTSPDQSTNQSII